MLSEFQQNTVWKHWLESEIRAAYFAALVQRFLLQQRILVVSGLALSSGATVTLMTTVVPPNLSWIKPSLTLLAAIVGLWSLVARNERNSIDCADLHSRWNALATGYESLWADMYGESAQDRLAKLREEEIAVSKSSTSQPAYRGLLEKVQSNVQMHHENQFAV